MSSTYAVPLARLEACLDELGAVDPVYRSTGEKQDALVRLARAKARLSAEEMRILAVADDVAEFTGDRSTAAWLATATRDSHGAVRASARLAAALETRWTRLQAVFAAGGVNLAQVRVIDKALTDLPGDLGDDLLVKAEAFLVEKAAELGPRDLAVLGERVLEYLAPDVAEEHEYARLVDQERRADAVTRVSVRRRGDGWGDLHARLPDPVLDRVMAYLNAFTAPRRRHLNTDHRIAANRTVQTAPTAGRDKVADLPIERQRGIAFAALLENIPTDRLPRHGGSATSVVFTVDHASMLADLDQAGIGQAGIGRSVTGGRVTVGQLRRLACQANLLPAVLGGRSEVLDLGRKRRLFS